MSKKYYCPTCKKELPEFGDELKTIDQDKNSACLICRMCGELCLYDNETDRVNVMTARQFCGVPMSTAGQIQNLVIKINREVMEKLEQEKEIAE